MYIKNKMETDPSIESETDEPIATANANAAAHPPYQRNMELCIPKVSVNISQKMIFKVFCNLKIGYIVRISENLLKNDPSYKRVIIRIHWDNTQPLAKQIQEHLKNPNEHMNIVYDMPWYWQIFANHPQRPTKYSCPSNSNSNPLNPSD
jgi:hypothetical protein